ncbi:MAG: hypothetical protein ACPH8E_05860 [Flavobacteriales bacterium]
MLKPLLRGGSCKTLLCAIVAIICSFCAQAQTSLYPGDVFVSMLTADVVNGNKIHGHVGFILLRDVAEGTTLTIRKDIWHCDEAGTCGWATTTDPQLMTWTAPAGGVTRGTEVIIVDTGGSMEPRQEDANGWSVAGGNSLDVLEGGEACGTVSGTPGDYNGSYLWVYQERNGVPHHLYLTGYTIDDADNTAQGTDLYKEGETAECNPVFAFEYFSEIVQWSLNVGFRNSFSVTPGIYGLFGASRGDLVPGNGNNGPFLVGSDYTMYSFENALGTTLINNLGNVNFPPAAVDVTWSNVNSNAGGADYGGDEALDIVVASAASKLVIDATAQVSCRDVQVYAGTFQSCDGNARTVKATRNFSMTAGEDTGFNGGMGMLKMGGSAAQNIDLKNYGNQASTKAKFFDLVLDNTNGVTMKGHGRMKAGGALEFTNGALTLADDPDGSGTGSSSMTFESNALKGTASIGPCSAANFGDGADQEFTFQRYIPADPDGSTWVNIGAYVTGTTVGDWTSANPSMLVFQYNESNYGSLGAGWTYLWDASTVLAPGSGYMALIPQGQDALFNVTGPFKMGDVNIDLTFTDDPNQSNITVDGWNLVSNPYPSPVNLVQVLSRVDGVEAFWIYDNTDAGSYITSNDMGVGDAPSTLDVGQSFWVKVSENQTLTFTEADKVSMSNTFIREYDEGFEGSFGVSVANGDNQWSRAFIQFQEGSTAAYATYEDALMYGDGSTNDVFVWTQAETGEKLSIQSLGSRAEVNAVPLSLTTGSNGTLRFTEHAHETSLEDLCVVLEDMESGAFMQLTSNDTLVLDAPANTTIHDRFVLHFTPAPTMEWQSTECDGLVIDLAGEDWESWDANWFAADGSASGSGLPYELEDGDYTFEFALPGSVCVQTIEVAVATACLGDFNLNGERDVVDLLVILSGLPSGSLENAFSEQADCDCDGVVTVNDMLTFLTVFGTACD